MFDYSTQTIDDDSNEFNLEEEEEEEDDDTNDIVNNLNGDEEINEDIVVDQEEDDDYSMTTIKANFNSIKISDGIEHHQRDAYFKVKIDDNQKYIHKQSACWLLTDQNMRLSNDRLSRKAAVVSRLVPIPKLLGIGIEGIDRYWCIRSIGIDSIDGLVLIGIEVLVKFTSLNPPIGRSSAILRQLFKDRYQQFFDNHWDDTPTAGGTFYTNIIDKGKNKSKFNLTTVQKRLIQKGNTNDWDITTLTSLLINVTSPQMPKKAVVQRLSEENRKIADIREIRNTLAHHTTKQLSNNEFIQLWHKLIAILVYFGQNEADLNKLKDDINFKSASASDSSVIDSENTKEALRLKDL
ncbi:unnamed protein product, partial [Didymodactylos carnosus]